MVITSVPALTLFAFAEDEAQSEYDYDKLYVGAEDGGSLFFAIDFYSAKEGDAFTSTSYSSTYKRFVTKSENASITISGGAKAASSPWMTTLSSSGYPRSFKVTGFGASSYNDALLIYENADAATGVENAIIYDSQNEEKFHTAAMESLGASYDFEKFNYYLLDDALFIYAVNKSTPAERYIYGFTGEYTVPNSGYKNGTTSFGNGYISLGQSITLTSNAVKLVRSKSNNASGDYTVELVNAATYATDSVTNQADTFKDGLLGINLASNKNNAPHNAYLKLILTGHVIDASNKDWLKQQGLSFVILCS